MMRQRGNEATIGLRLGELVQIAGGRVIDVDARFDVVELTPELRPPSRGPPFG